MVSHGYLFCNSLMTYNVEHHFMYLFAICIFDDVSAQIFSPFLNQVVCFLIVQL